MCKVGKLIDIINTSVNRLNKEFPKSEIDILEFKKDGYYLHIISKVSYPLQKMYIMHIAYNTDTNDIESIRIRDGRITP